MEDKKTKKFSFSAIDKYLEINEIRNFESDINGYKFVQWGDKNLYPSFIFDTYANSQILKSIIASVIDYVVGNGADSKYISQQKLEKIINALAFSLAVYGGFCINVLRNKIGGIADIIVLDFRNVRISKVKDKFFYSEHFSDKSYGRCKYIEYPKFDKNDKAQFSSIFYYSNTIFQTYPVPVWSAAVDAALVDAQVGKFHQNSLANNFAADYMISLNNGVPSDAEQEEIEEAFNEKFCGTENAARVLLSFSIDKEHAPEIISIPQTDYKDKYTSLEEWSRNKLFMAFRCNPNLCGIATENLGFNSEEYESSFKLFNRTVILPLQKIIKNTFAEIYDDEEALSITPFSL